MRWVVPAPSERNIAFPRGEFGVFKGEHAHVTHRLRAIWVFPQPALPAISESPRPMTKSCVVLLSPQGRIIARRLRRLALPFNSARAVLGFGIIDVVTGSSICARTDAKRGTRLFGQCLQGPPFILKVSESIRILCDCVCNYVGYSNVACKVRFEYSS